MMIFNGKNHLVFPLVPTDCAHAKLHEYFGKLQNSKIEALQAQGDFGGNLSARGVLRAKSNDCDVKWKVTERRFQKWKTWFGMHSYDR